MNIFDHTSAERLSHAHPLLQKLMNAAREKSAFMILQSQRGRLAQEEAYAKGFSQVHFGDSAHNWSPSVALDIAPLPLSWDAAPSNLNRWRTLQMEIIKPVAKELGIPIRQGIDWNRNGILTDESFIDRPHVELYPWRTFAQHDCKPYQG